MTGQAVFPYRPPMGAVGNIPDFRNQGSESTIAKGDALVVNYQVDLPPRSLIEAWITDSWNLHVFGTVFYEDIFDETWQTNLFFFIRNGHILAALDAPSPRRAGRR